MFVRVSLCGMYRMIRVDTLRKVNIFGFLVERLLYIGTHSILSKVEYIRYDHGMQVYSRLVHSISSMQNICKHINNINRICHTLIFDTT